jgi:hypothetical protein
LNFAAEKTPLHIQRRPWRLIWNRSANFLPALAAKDQFCRIVPLANKTQG